MFGFFKKPLLALRLAHSKLQELNIKFKRSVEVWKEHLNSSLRSWKQIWRLLQNRSLSKNVLNEKKPGQKTSPRQYWRLAPYFVNNSKKNYCNLFHLKFVSLEIIFPYEIAGINKFYISRIHFFQLMCPNSKSSK